MKGICGICGQRYAGLDNGLRVADHFRGTLGGFGALGSQLLHLAGHHREPLSGSSGPGGLYRGVEGQDISLERNVLNVFGDFCNLAGPLHL